MLFFLAADYLVSLALHFILASLCRRRDNQMNWNSFFQDNSDGQFFQDKPSESLVGSSDIQLLGFPTFRCWFYRHSNVGFPKTSLFESIFFADAEISVCVASMTVVARRRHIRPFVETLLFQFKRNMIHHPRRPPFFWLFNFETFEMLMFVQLSLWLCVRYFCLNNIWIWFLLLNWILIHLHLELKQHFLTPKNMLKTNLYIVLVTLLCLYFSGQAIYYALL